MSVIRRLDRRCPLSNRPVGVKRFQTSRLGVTKVSPTKKTSDFQILAPYPERKAATELQLENDASGQSCGARATVNVPFSFQLNTPRAARMRQSIERRSVENLRSRLRYRRFRPTQTRRLRQATPTRSASERECITPIIEYLVALRRETHPPEVCQCCCQVPKNLLISFPKLRVKAYSTMTPDAFTSGVHLRSWLAI